MVYWCPGAANGAADDAIRTGWLLLTPTVVWLLLVMQSPLPAGLPQISPW